MNNTGKSPVQLKRVKFEVFAFVHWAFPEYLVQMPIETVWFWPSSDCGMLVLKALTYLGRYMLRV